MVNHQQKPMNNDRLSQSIDNKAKRKMKAKKNKRHPVWFGLGMFGLIGWSVMIPLIACIALGIWIDRHWPGQISWTLTLLFVGVVIGCLNAWHWIIEERKDD